MRTNQRRLSSLDIIYVSRTNAAALPFSSLTSPGLICGCVSASDVSVVDTSSVDAASVSGFTVSLSSTVSAATALTSDAASVLTSFSAILISLCETTQSNSRSHPVVRRRPLRRSCTSHQVSRMTCEPHRQQPSHRPATQHIPVSLSCRPQPRRRSRRSTNSCRHVPSRFARCRHCNSFSQMSAYLSPSSHMSIQARVSENETLPQLR